MGVLGSERYFLNKSKNRVTVNGFRRSGFTENPRAMRDLRVYGKNRLLGLFGAWLKKQTGVKARAGRPAPPRLPLARRKYGG